jgi:hypothetical protein
VKDIHKVMFPVYGKKCLARKAVHNWVEKFSQGRSQVADDGRPGVQVADTTFRTLLCFRFRRTYKAMGRALIKRWDKCWWKICREINVFFFPVSNIIYEYFTFYIHLLPIY